MDWSQRWAEADAQIDDGLGDTIEFAADGVAYVSMQCFVFPPGAEADISFAPIDPLSGKPRILVAMAKIAEPSLAHRFKVPQLADPAVTLWRPENWTKVRGGRYWIMDIQKAVT